MKLGRIAERDRVDLMFLARMPRFKGTIFGLLHRATVLAFAPDHDRHAGYGDDHNGARMTITVTAIMNVPL